MLSPADNELLVRCGPTTPMGELFRRFWTPTMLADELDVATPAAGLRILGEDLLAFRAGDGNVVLREAACPPDRARTSYAALERGGLIWGYLGPPELQPEFPAFEAFAVPPGQRSITKMMARGNYAQFMEGDVDSSHVSFLHSRQDGQPIPGGRIGATVFSDRMPRWFTDETAYGLKLSAQRDAGADAFHWRVNQYLMPYAVLIASPPGNPVLTQIRVPIDDGHTLHFRVWSQAERPLSSAERAVLGDGITVPELVPGTFATKEAYENDYLIDRAEQRTSSFTGIRSIVAQDLAVTQDQGGYGTIADRSREYLTSSDKAIIALRKRLLTSAKELLRGIEPPEARNPQAYAVRPGEYELPRALMPA